MRVACEWCGATIIKPRWRHARFCNGSCRTAWRNAKQAKSIDVRFWAYVYKAVDGCWYWQGPRYPNDYGRLELVGGKMIGAHRLSYKLNVGPIPEKQFVLHHCDTPYCVNPAHLFLGTQLDNMRDRRAKGR